MSLSYFQVRKDQEFNEGHPIVTVETEQDQSRREVGISL